MVRREVCTVSFPMPSQSVVSDAAAQRLLSTVESRPEIIINRNGTSTHVGSSEETNSKLTMPVSLATKPDPAARKPTVPMQIGTSANKSAPAKNDLPMRSRLIAKARCQKH